jgi:NTE family protein
MSYQKKNIDFSIVKAVADGIKRNTIDLYEVPLMQVASILTEAEMDYFIKEVNKIFGVWSDKEAEDLLINNSIYIEERSVYSLDDTTRNKVLQGMRPEQIRALAKKIEPTSTDVMQKLYLEFILGKAKSIELMTLDELVATYNIAQWCKNTSVRLPNLELVNVRIRQQELQFPLTRLTRNFKGRHGELKKLENYYKIRCGGFIGVYVGKLFKLKAVRKPIFITGIGGTGKSTLVSQSILLQLSKGKPIFIYIDFDRPGISIGNVFSLLKEALRQWVIQVPKFRKVFESSKELIEDDYGGKNKNTGSVSSVRKLLYERIFTKENLELLKYLKEPVIVVFDSFEELQYRAKPSDIQPLFELLKELGGFIPQLRPVFVGRSEFDSDVDNFEKIVLSGFDEPSATGFLDSMGIADRVLQQHIYKTFGSSPLTLKLAANLIIKQIGKGPLTFDAVERKGLFGQVDQALTQEELVARNLEHIHAKDKRVKQIAVPGILVRKINPFIILHVLARPCGLGSINLNTAEQLFKKLRRESFLFEDHGADITFRQDLRKALYPRILKNNSYVVAGIHDAAVAYYEGKKDLSDKAEYLYHRLMRGDDPGIIDDIYTTDMKPYIEKAMVEFPEKAYLHFAVVLGLVITDNQLQRLALTDWDVYMRRHTKEVLKKGNKEQLVKLGQLFKQRHDRWEGSKVWREEVYVWFRLNSNNKLSPIIQSMINNLEKGNEDWLFIRLIQFKKAEHTLSWDHVSQDLKDDVPHFDYSNLNTIYFLLHHSIQLYRGDCRLGNDVEKSILRVKMVARRMGKLLMEKDGSLSRFFSFLPYPYIFFFEQEYKMHQKLAVNKVMQNEVDFFVSYLVERKLYFWNKKLFTKTFYNFIAHYPTVIDLERYLKRYFGVFLKDITEPGEYPILLYEALLFVEIHPDFESSTVISSAGKFYKVRGKLPIAAFTENDEVTRCLSKLKLVFQKQKLNISDLRDNEGYQYVNLVLNAQGVHGFALLGFTYVMEEMGIRFHRISGAGAGALHAAFLSSAISEDGIRSRKLLERYCELDFRKLRDGGRIYNKFFLDLVSKGSILVWLTTFCMVTLLLLSVVFIKLMDFSWTDIAIAKNIFFVLGLFTCIAVYIFMHKLFKLNKGEGINSGKALHKWIRSIFDKESILTIEDLERRVMEEDRFIHTKDFRFLQGFTLEPRLKMVAAEMVTLRKVVFPEMYDLFRNEEYKNTLFVADIIHACMASPVFFKTVTIRNIPKVSNSVISAWKKRFGITDVPSTAFLGATGISPIIKDDANDGAPLLPCFGAFVERYRYNKKTFNNGISAYFARLVRRVVDADEDNRGSEKVIYKRGISRISINNQRYHSLNYGLTGEDKIELFIKGVAAATEFLLHFDWADYKEQMTIIRKQRGGE